MSYLDNSGQDASPSFLQALARSLGLGGSQPPQPPNRAALASALSGQPLPPPGTHYAQLPGPPLLLPDNGDALASSAPRAPSALAGPAAPPLAAAGPLATMRGALSDIPGALQAASAGQLPQVAAPSPSGAAKAIVVPGYEAKGPLTRAQVSAAPDDDKTMPAEEDWDQAAAKVAAGPAGTQVAQATPPAQAPMSAYEQTLKARFDQQEQLIRTTTNPEVAKMAIAEANKINDELSAFRKPGETILTEADRIAAGLPKGVYQRSAVGQIAPIAGTQEPKDTVPAEIQNYKFDQQNRAEKGLAPISFSDWNTQKTLYGKNEQPLMDANGKPIESSAAGDELLQALPPAVANHAKAIVEIREKWPSGTEQARQPQLQQALIAAQQLDPTLNQQTYQTRQSMKNAAESGSGRINVANLANNTALFHSNTLADAIVALNNSNNTILNAAVNSGAGPAGGIIPGAVTKADEVKQFDVARNAVSNELERSFHGVGTTAEQAVKRQIDDLSVNDAPQTQLGALKAAQDLLRGKIEANEADYRDTMGDRNIAAWERDHGRPFGFITPAAKSAGERVAAMYESVKAGKGFHGFEPGAQPGAGAAPLPISDVSPSGAPAGTRQALDGKFYAPDPARPGKYLQVNP